MNHHLHQLHHRHPTPPWTALPTLAREIAVPSATVGDAAYFRTALRQFLRFGNIR
jgi:hypothetical protein